MTSQALSSDTAAHSGVTGHDRASRPTSVLRPPAFSPFAIVGHLAALWRYRDLLLTLTAHRLAVRYKQSALGPSWAVLQPLALMLIYTVLFSRIAHVQSDGAPYAVFAYTALLPWTTFSTALGNATNGLVGHSGLITKVYFPREILPLSYIIAALADFVIAGVVLAGLLIYYRIPLGANALYLIPIVGVMMIFALAGSLLLATLQVRFRDIGVGLPLLLQIWMFATPVVYPLSAVMGTKKLSATVKFLYTLNPMVGVVENFRRAILQDAPPDPATLWPAVLISLLLLPLTYAYFKRSEATMADVI